MSASNSLYITLQYQTTTKGVNQYHWSLYVTSREPPIGHLIHATDAGHDLYDLHREIRPLASPMKLARLDACLKVAYVPDSRGLIKAISAIPIMDEGALPTGEKRWTSRLWVREVLGKLQKERLISLPVGIDEIDTHAQFYANQHLYSPEPARVFNDCSWLPVTDFEASLPHSRVVNV